MTVESAAANQVQEIETETIAPGLPNMNLHLRCLVETKS